MRSVNILGVPIHHVTMAQTIAWVVEKMHSDALHQICTANPEFVMKAQEDAAFLDVLQRSDLNVADGIGLVLASRRLQQPLPERVAGSELVYHLAEQCAANGWQLFLLGAAEGVAERAAVELQRLYPGLVIAGTYAGSPSEAENGAIVEMVEASSADMLFVAYGAPAQDKWIAHNRDNLTTVRVALGVGGSLDFIAGDVKRAPAMWQHIHLEWLYRLIQQPSRWRRLMSLPKFVFALLRKR